MIRFAYLLCWVLLVTTACESNEKKVESSAQTEQRDLKQEAYDEIIGLEKQLMLQTGIPDTLKASQLAKLYLAYAMNNMKDDAAAEFMFKSGELRMGIGHYIKAIETFEQLNTSFPTYEKVPETHYLIAFIYDNYLDNKGMAEAKYKVVIDKFPKLGLAKDARIAIDNLSLTDEELIEKFEKQNGL